MFWVILCLNVRELCFLYICIYIFHVAVSYEVFTYVIYQKLYDGLRVHRETGVHSHVESYPKLKKWYSITPCCLSLRIIRYGSRVSGAIQWKEYCSPLHLVTIPTALDYGRPTKQLYDFKFSNRILISCMNFWDKTWFLSFRVFELLSLSLHSQRFVRCVLRPSSVVPCRTREPTRNFEPRPLFNLRRSLGSCCGSVKSPEE